VTDAEEDVENSELCLLDKRLQKESRLAIALVTGVAGEVSGVEISDAVSD